LGLFSFEMSSSVSIDAPVERVWDLVETARNWPKWSETVSKVWDAPDEHGWGWIVGLRFGFLLKMANREVPFFVNISRIEPGELIQWRSTKFTITAVRSISVKQENGGCAVTDSKHFSSYLLPIRIAYPRGVIRRMTESWLSELRNEAESKN
jgi:uncharacterized membrane protein